MDRLMNGDTEELFTKTEEKKERKKAPRDFSKFSPKLPSSIIPSKRTPGNRILPLMGQTLLFITTSSQPYSLDTSKKKHSVCSHSTAQLVSIGCVGYVNVIPPVGKGTLSPGTVQFWILNLVWIPAALFPWLPCCGSPTYCTALDCLPLCNNPESHSPSAMYKLLPLYSATGLVYPFKKVGKENAFSWKRQNRCVCPLV